jgi:hypothetical protein
VKDLLTYLDRDKLPEQALQDFEAMTPTLFREPGVVAKFLKEPFVRTAILSFDGKPAYLTAFRITEDCGMWVDIVKALDGGCFDRYVNLMTKTAKNLGCKYIRFATARHGLIELMKGHGFKVDSVIMVKGI